MAIEIKTNIDLAPFTTFLIGGKSDYFTEVATAEEMQEAFLFAEKRGLPFLILGKGSNSLFSDRGFPGLVILNKISYLHLEGSLVDVGSGYSFSLLGTQTARSGLSGLEFASGIPGSVGGAIWMNAGANQRETKDSLTSVTFLDSHGKRHLFSKEELAFSYRTSPFQKMQGAILSATFSLTPSPDARKQQIALIEKRKETQPLKDPSAGCVFRNPPGHASGALIEASGLKGMRIGGAEVSTVHANFIVNRGGATAEDVIKLATLIQKTVKEKQGITLELELHQISDV